MGLFDNLQKAFGFFGEFAKERVNETKTDFRIRSLRRDISKLYVKIGRNYYEADRSDRKISNEVIEECYNKIDSLKKRIKNLENKEVEVKRSIKLPIEETKKAQIIIEKNHEEPLVMDINKNDFRMERTSEGIKFIKVCVEPNPIDTTEPKEDEKDIKELETKMGRLNAVES